jgi:hypothetical protein
MTCDKILTDKPSSPSHKAEAKKFGVADLKYETDNHTVRSYQLLAFKIFYLITKKQKSYLDSATPKILDLKRTLS